VAKNSTKEGHPCEFCQIWNFSLQCS